MVRQTQKRSSASRGSSRLFGGKPSISGLHRLTGYDYAIYAAMALLNLIFLYPLWYTFVISVSSSNAMKTGIPLLIPKGFTMNAYRMLFRRGDILLYYWNSIVYAVGGTVISLLLTTMTAYPFIVKEFRGKKFFNIYFIITMYFGGGLLPTYFLINAMGLRNTIWVIWIPGAVSAYNLILYRTFFKSIPDSLTEAATIDGAGHFRILFQVIVPLSKPMLATFALFGLVAKWNDWFTPTIYLGRESMTSMQQFLQTNLSANTTNLAEDPTKEILAINLQCAMIIVTIAPILMVYPFLQKYFVSGIMIGSIKE